MNHIELLEFVSRELKGRALTASSIAAFAVIERTSRELNMTDVSRLAAQLTVLFPRLDTEHIAESFGQEIASTCEKIRPTNSYASISQKAVALLDNDRELQDAALAVIAAEISTQAARDREGLAKALSLISIDLHDPVRQAFLEQQKKRLAMMPLPEEADNPSKSRVISISMDICGSTKTKQRMRECAQDQEQLEEWYKEFQISFLCKEWRFYESLFSSRHRKFALDWRKAFFVKGIGDEIWLLYEIPEDENWKLPTVVKHLLDAALDAAGQKITWTSVPSCIDDDEGHESGDEEQWEIIQQPMKFYIDIIDDAFDFTVTRRDFITDRLHLLLNRNDDYPDEDFLELGNRLHAGVLEMDGRRLVTTTRTDYIGWEVDRYFRMTKYALPCVVSVGKDLFEEILGDSPNAATQVGATNLFKAVFSYKDTQGPSVHWEHSFFFVKKEIPANCLKGIGENYAVCHVVRKGDLLGFCHNGVDPCTMAPTHAVFTKDMVDAVKLGGSYLV